jgi:hypothetical protein
MKTSTMLLFSLCLAALTFAGASTLAGQGQAPAAPAPAGQTAGRGAPPPPPPPQAGHPSGQLVIWGDLSLFESPGKPDNCILTNRFKRGQRVGFRMTAFDGGTGEVENTAMLVAHITVGGATIDVPMRFRGAAGASAPPPRGYLRPPTGLWTGFWVVPADAPVGALSYTVTATDKFGRKAVFTPFPYDNSQLAIVN